MNNEFINCFKKSARQNQLQINEEVKIMKEGLAEVLYMFFKEECNDMDAYTFHLNELYKQLIDSYYDFLGTDGRPVPRFKTNHEQHRLLSTAVSGITEMLGEDLAYDLSISGLTKLAERRRERKAQRLLSSGTKPERENFDGTRPQVVYAGHLNDRGEYEFASSRN